MLNRFIRFALVGAFATAIAGYGVAYAQDDDDDDNDAGGDTSAGDDDDGGGDAGGDTGGDAGGDTGAAPAGGDAAEAPAEGGGMHLLMPKGKIGIHASIEVNMSADAVGKPFSIAPDVWYGVNDKLTAGLVHSTFGATGFLVGAGSGLCLAGEENGCAKVYDALGVEALYGVMMDGKMQLAANGGLHVNSFDPMMLALKVGVVGQYMAGKIGVMFSPNISIGLTERDFNKEVLWIPVGVMYAVSPKLAAGVQTGIAGPLDGFGDAFIVPLAIGAHMGVNEKLMVGGAFGFTNIGGKNSSADGRSLQLMVGYKL